MLFSSNLFLFLYLPFVLLVYYLLPKRLRNFFLLCASMVGLCGNAFFDDMVVRTLAQHRYFYLAAAICSTPVLKNTMETVRRKNPRAAALMEAVSVPSYLFLLLWSVSYIMMGSHNPFIYFNF